VPAPARARAELGVFPRDLVTGLRPFDCINCTWAVVRGVSTLKVIHSECPSHRGLPRATDGLRSWMLAG
jgi:hypothetical protein